VGPRCQRERGKRPVPVQDITRVGYGPDLELGRIGPRRPFLIFSFSFSFLFLVFLISFILFANLIQIKSNHIQRFCKIYNRVLNQYETSFQEQHTILNKASLISKEDLLA
jgi:hypothetical protein